MLSVVRLVRVLYVSSIDFWFCYFSGNAEVPSRINKTGILSFCGRIYLIFRSLFLSLFTHICDEFVVCLQIVWFIGCVIFLTIQIQNTWSVSFNFHYCISSWKLYMGKDFPFLFIERDNAEHTVRPEQGDLNLD